MSDEKPDQPLEGNTGVRGFLTFVLANPFLFFFFRSLGIRSPISGVAFAGIVAGAVVFAYLGRYRKYALGLLIGYGLMTAVSGGWCTGWQGFGFP